MSDQRTAGISLRPAGDADRAFLRAVYASTREDELARTDWPDAQKEAFVTQQFEAQDHHYRTHYTGASYHVILMGNAPAGRLYVARWSEEIRIMDIALLPDFRSRGIGTALIGDLIAEGRRCAKRVSIHVEMFNPAQTLYLRLGFKPVQETGVYRLMEWSPSDRSKT